MTIARPETNPTAKSMTKPTVAILDMYRGIENMGMANIQSILAYHDFPYRVWDVRGKNEVPNSSYDIYISTGGPGSPFDGEREHWEANYFRLIDKIWNHNQTHERKKYVFFICHSFQMMVRLFEIGDVCKRKSMSFGVFPIHKTQEGEKDTLFQGLADPFYAADFRSYQVTHPNDKNIAALGGTILSLEKVRPSIALDRAIMAMRISPEFIGTQFHPEADPIGMREYFRNPKKREDVVKAHGESKYENILDQLHEEDADSILQTYRHLIPTFLTQSYQAWMMFG
ncbi:MAG: type 1 glutamine amidotransferase [Bacteroidia bacterium]